jgi:hypothetical protein
MLIAYVIDNIVPSPHFSLATGGGGYKAAFKVSARVTKRMRVTAQQRLELDLKIGVLRGLSDRDRYLRSLLVHGRVHRSSPLSYTQASSMQTLNRSPRPYPAQIVGTPPGLRCICHGNVRNRLPSCSESGWSCPARAAGSRIPVRWLPAPYPGPQQTVQVRAAGIQGSRAGVWLFAFHAGRQAERNESTDLTAGEGL